MLPSEGRPFTIPADPDHMGRRADLVVAEKISDCSRSIAADLIRAGKIKICGAVKKPGYRLKAEDEIKGFIPAPTPLNLQPEPIDFKILHEDSDLIVLDKPAGLVVHPAAGHTSGTLVNALLYHCDDLAGIGGKERPGIVHRLDKDTSGLIMAAKNDAAHQHLSEQFKSRSIEKRYLALVYGEMAAQSGEISFPIGRDPNDRKRMWIDTPSGKPAWSRWKVREQYEGASLLEVLLMTGRTHQIRVHLCAVGHPIIGDPLYNRNRPGGRFSKTISDRLKGITRQMLHAWKLRFLHPATGAPLSCVSPPPPDMETLLRLLKREARH